MSTRIIPRARNSSDFFEKYIPSRQPKLTVYMADGRGVWTAKRIYPIF